MPKSVESATGPHDPPSSGDRRAIRHFGDGYAGDIVASRLQGYDSSTLAYVDVAVDSSGQVKTTGAAGGGGAATIADGADVAQGSTTDLSSANTVVGILKAIKAAVTTTLTVAGSVGRTWTLSSGTDSVAVSGTVTADTELPAAAALTDAVVNPTTPMAGSATMLWDSTLNAGAGGWLRAPGTVAAGLKVQSGQLPAALVGGRLSVDASGVAVPITDNAGSITVDAPVGTPTFVRLSDGAAAITTLPVSLATNTPDVTDRAGRLLGIVDKGKIWDGTNIAAVKAASAIAAAADPAVVVQHAPQRADAANLCVTNTAATGVACTLTIPSAGAGLFHYLSLIEIQLYATAARTGGATPVLVTTTNLPGSPVWDFDTAQAIGVTIRQTTQPATPIKSSAAATATTIVAPIATTGIWRITAYYYAAP